MYREKRGVLISLDSQSLSSFINFPSFFEEEKEYEKIQNYLNKKLGESLTYRHYFILASDWWGESIPSCWLSFHFLDGSIPILIVSMRSCNMRTFGSDLGFLARLALSIKSNTSLMWIINSLHIEE